MELGKHTPKPARIIVYGPPGIGKTTFASQADDVVFVPTEDGLGNLEVDAFPVSTSFHDVLAHLQTLGQEEHKYRTVCIDSLDWLEPLIWDATCDRIGVASIEAAGYGKGYTEAGAEWKKFFEYLNALRDYKGMTVVMLAHSQVVRIEDPEYPAYDSHSLKLHKRASAMAGEYADIIGFATLKTIVKSEDAGFGNKRTRALSTGDRILHVSGTASYIAKNRYGMPDTLPFKWGALREFLPALQAKTTAPKKKKD